MGQQESEVHPQVGRGLLAPAVGIGDLGSGIGDLGSVFGKDVGRGFSPGITLIGATLLTAALFAQAPPSPIPADKPSPRTDANSKTAHEQHLAKRTQGRIDVYFQGDSITRRWGALDYPDFLANWKENFFGWNAADFGWGADRTENILWRIANGELDDVHPKVIVLLAGTNNIGTTPPSGADDARVANVTRGVTAIVDAMRAKAPEATVILMGIFPRNDNIAVMPIVTRINANLAAAADGRRVRYLNINDKLAGPDGKLFEGMSRDGLHPALKGYQVWADALKPMLTELLGPPGKEDHAPPPTGDPSAAKPAQPR
jgi:lysophospholipase L1-like esterase